MCEAITIKKGKSQGIEMPLKITFKSWCLNEFTKNKLAHGTRANTHYLYRTNSYYLDNSIFLHILLGNLRS